MKNSKNKRSSHPVMFFIYLSVLLIVLSGIASALNMQVTYETLTTIVGEVDSQTVGINSLLSLDGLKFLLTSSYETLTSFNPFSMLLIAAIGFGVAYKSGYLKSLCSKITKKVPKFIVVFIYALLCIIASIDSNLGYVLLMPLGAILFMSMNRNPILGLALGFVTSASGHGAGLFLTQIDYNLSSYTEAAAKLLDSEYMVSEYSNIIFIIVASLLIAGVATFITEKIMVKKMGRNNLDEEEFMLEESDEKKGLLGALIATIVFIIPFILMIIPSENSFLGLLLDKTQSTYSKMLLSSDALFINNLTPIISLLFLVQGTVFGIISGTVKKVRDLVVFTTDYLKSIGGIFVLIFFASTLISIAAETNFGVVLTGLASNLIGNLNFSFVPLMLVLLVITMLLNVLLPGSTAKWSILAPNIMVGLMKANITPEFAQIIFRAGDSITNSITPIFGYFVIFIGFVEIYTKNKLDFGIRKCYKSILPYFAGIAIVWIIMIICWYVIGLPIGPGIYPSV